MTQEELLPLIYNKDQKSLNLLYDNFGKSLYSVLFSSIKEPQLTENALFNTFEYIWDNLNEYNSEKERFFTWLLKCARTQAIHYLQENNVSTSTPSLTTDNFGSLTNKGFEASFSSLLTQKFVRQLKPKQIKILDLLLFKNFTVSETAEILDITESNLILDNKSCLTSLINTLEIR
jgi:RNA polymerase sigma factor (sigma-70 family)